MLNFINLFYFVSKNYERISEIKNEYLKLLGELTVVSDLSDEIFFENLKQINETGKIIVGIENNKIISSGTIIIEPKIIRGGKSVGHIEDIVVLEEMRGKGIAQKLLKQLINIGYETKCYKVILDCEIELESFYEKSGFVKKGIQMSKYF